MIFTTLATVAAIVKAMTATPKLAEKISGQLDITRKRIAKELVAVAKGLSDLERQQVELARQKQKTVTRIVSQLLAGEPDGQRDRHRVFPDFILSSMSHRLLPLLP